MPGPEPRADGGAAGRGEEAQTCKPPGISASAKATAVQRRVRRDRRWPALAARPPVAALSLRRPVAADADERRRRARPHLPGRHGRRAGARAGAELCQSCLQLPERAGPDLLLPGLRPGQRRRRHVPVRPFRLRGAGLLTSRAWRSAVRARGAATSAGRCGSSDRLRPGRRRWRGDPDALPRRLGRPRSLTPSETRRYREGLPPGG